MQAAESQDAASSTTSTDPREWEVLRVAEAFFEKTPEWVTFFQVLLGVDGVVPRLYPTVDDMAEFERSQANARIQQMLSTLRRRKKDQKKEQSPQRMITVRLPAAVHDALRAEAGLRDISMNQLCISKLMQMIDNDRIPGKTPSEEVEELIDSADSEEGNDKD